MTLRGVAGRAAVRAGRGRGGGSRSGTPGGGLRDFPSPSLPAAGRGGEASASGDAFGRQPRRAQRPPRMQNASRNEPPPLPPGGRGEGKHATELSGSILGGGRPRSGGGGRRDRRGGDAGRGDRGGGFRFGGGQSDGGRNRSDNFFDFGGHSGGRTAPERGRRAGREAAWLADDVRDLATEALRAAAADGAAAAAARALAARGPARPFEGGDFSALLREIPGDHWAAPYLGEVASALEGNADIPAPQKFAVLNETLTALRTGAGADDGRFEDVEEDANSVEHRAVA